MTAVTRRPVTSSSGSVVLLTGEVVTGYGPVFQPKGQKTGLSRTFKHYVAHLHGSGPHLNLRTHSLQRTSGARASKTGLG